MPRFLKPIDRYIDIMTDAETQPRWLEIAARKREAQQMALTSFIETYPVPQASKSLIEIDDIAEVCKEVVTGKVFVADLVVAYCHQ